MNNLITKYYKKYRELIMYITFGMLTTAVNYCSYIILAHPLKLSVAVSNILAWIISVMFAFITNKLWVFESKSLNKEVVVKELCSFVSCRLLSGIIDTGIMILFVDWIHLNDIIIKIAANVFVVIINYILSKTVIFTKKEQTVNG